MRSMEITYVPGNVEGTKPNLSDEDPSGLAQSCSNGHKEVVRDEVRRGDWLSNCSWKPEDVDVFKWGDRVLWE